MFSRRTDPFDQSSLFEVNIVFVALPSFLCVNIDSLSYSRVTQAYYSLKENLTILFKLARSWL